MKLVHWERDLEFGRVELDRLALGLLEVLGVAVEVKAHREED